MANRLPGRRERLALTFVDKTGARASRGRSRMDSCRSKTVSHSAGCHFQTTYPDTCPRNSTMFIPGEGKLQAGFLSRSPRGVRTASGSVPSKRHRSLLDDIVLGRSIAVDRLGEHPQLTLTLSG